MEVHPFMKTLFVVCLLTVGLGAGLHAQAPARPLTPTELRAKVAALEQTLAGMQHDFELIVTTCHGDVAPAPVERRDRVEGPSSRRRMPRTLDASRTSNSAASKTSRGT
jgi:hypothetical protein